MQNWNFCCNGRNILLAAVAAVVPVVVLCLFTATSAPGLLVCEANTPICEANTPIVLKVSTRKQVFFLFTLRNLNFCPPFPLPLSIVGSIHEEEFIYFSPFRFSIFQQPSQLAVGLGRRYCDTDPFVVPRKAGNLDEFLKELKPALDMRQLIKRPVELIFDNSRYLTDLPHPSCTGDWLEFGVFMGGTLNAAAEFRERFCGPDSGEVYGFDTFTGLPEKWRGNFENGAFSLNGTFPDVRHNVELVKGIFSDCLPPWIEAQKARNNGQFPPISYLHIDCDLYAGAKDALELLKDYIVPGCVLIFDEVRKREGSATLSF